MTVAPPRQAVYPCTAPAFSMAPAGRHYLRAEPALSAWDGAHIGNRTGTGHIDHGDRVPNLIQRSQRRPSPARGNGLQRIRNIRWVAIAGGWFGELDDCRHPPLLAFLTAAFVMPTPLIVVPPECPPIVSDCTGSLRTRPDAIYQESQGNLGESGRTGTRLESQDGGAGGIHPFLRLRSRDFDL